MIGSHKVGAFALAALMWSPWTQQLVTPAVLEQQGIAEYGPATWAIVRPVVTGESALAPNTPTGLTLS